MNRNLQEILTTKSTFN